MKAACLGLALALGASLPALAQRVKDVFEVGPAVYVRALTVEPARGALWVGTSAGVHEVDLASGKLRNTFTRKEGLANEYVFAVGLDRKGHKWFGTNAGGVSRYKDGQWKTFFPMHGLADYWIYSFAEQKSGDFWIGTWAGVNKVDGRTGKFSTYVKELVNEWVYGISVDAQDRVWFGTEGGVSLFDGKRWQSWTHKDGLGAPNDDNLPFSTNTGLGQPDGEGRPGRQHRLRGGARQGRAALVRHQPRAVALGRQDLQELGHGRGPAREQRLRRGGGARWRCLGRHAQGRGAHRALMQADDSTESGRWH
jgi:Two component regulator propeller